MAITALAISNFRAHRVRTALTVAAIALSVSLVVAVTSGYRSVEDAVERYFVQYMGATDVLITRAGDHTASLDELIAQQIRQDPRVKRAVSRMEVTARLEVDDAVRPSRRMSLIGVSLPEDMEIQSLRMEPSASGKVGQWFTGDAGNVAVIDQEAAKVLKADIGSEITIPLLDERLKLTVVGIIHKPSIIAHTQQSIYVPLRTVQRFLHREGQVNRILVTLHQPSRDAEFRAAWEPVLLKQNDQVKMRLGRDSRKEIQQRLQISSFLSYMGGAVSMLAAGFIVFSTISMGVTERTRVLAMLRSVGASKWQIGRLVVIEAIVLASIGALVGVPLGYAWVRILAVNFHHFFPTGVTLSAGGVLFGAGGSVGAAIVASFLPALTAMRVAPLDALTPLGKNPAWGRRIVAAVIGLLCISVDPLLMFVPGLPRAMVFWGHFFAGLPLLMIGYFLMAPIFVVTIERVFGRFAALLMGVNFSLLRQQLSGSAWRAAGTAASLMVGLAILVVLHTQGNTIMAGWTLPTRFPDMFILSPLGGLTPEKIDKIKTVPGIKPDEVMPVALKTAGLPEGALSIGLSGAMPDSTLFIGIDPDKALEMMALDFRDDNGKTMDADSAAKATLDAAYKLKAKIVTLKDRTELMGQVRTVNDQTEVASYSWARRQIPASSVAPAITGKDALVADLRKLAGREAEPRAIVLKLRDGGQVMGVMIGRAPRAGGTYDLWSWEAKTRTVPTTDVKSIASSRHIIVTDEFRALKGLTVGKKIKLRTGLLSRQEYTVAGATWSPGIDVMVTLFDMSQQFDEWSAGTVFGSLEDARVDFGADTTSMICANLEYSAGEKQTVTKRVSETLKKGGLIAADVRDIKQKIEAGFRQLLKFVSFVAYAAIAVASLGVVNTILASVRTRRWQLGILRSVGVTRGQLLRLILAEAVLLGLVAVALGVLAGLEMSVNANGLGKRLFGYGPSIVVPWEVVGFGAAVVMVVALVASFWPAAGAARSEPLDLLQAGRAAA